MDNIIMDREVLYLTSVNGKFTIYNVLGTLDAIIQVGHIEGGSHYELRPKFFLQKKNKAYANELTKLMMMRHGLPRKVVLALCASEYLCATFRRVCLLRDYEDCSSVTPNSDSLQKAILSVCKDNQNKAFTAEEVDSLTKHVSRLKEGTIHMQALADYMNQPVDGACRHGVFA